MRKNVEVSAQRRVLARVLAEELKVVSGGGDPVTVTGPQPNGRQDITNVSADTEI